MILEGPNLGKREVEYMPLSEHQFFNDEIRQQLLKKIEKLYFDFWMESKKTDIQPLPRKNGKIELLPGMINHRCPDSLETLRLISQMGVLATEWFGVIEYEQEGAFCTFVDRIHNEENPTNRANIFNLQRLQSPSNDILLFFDTENPIMKKLIHLDYFEYIKIKQQTPDKIKEIYTSEEIEIFDQIIEPLSGGSKNYHVKNILPKSDWSAIPGGIPPTLINGICTKKKTYDKNFLDEIIRLFPNATIFNGQLEILYIPEHQISEEDQEFVEDIVGDESVYQDSITTGGRSR